MSYYDLPTLWTDLELVMDLSNGRVSRARPAERGAQVLRLRRQAHARRLPTERAGAARNPVGSARCAEPPKILFRARICARSGWLGARHPATDALRRARAPGRARSLLIALATAGPRRSRWRPAASSCSPTTAQKLAQALMCRPRRCSPGCGFVDARHGLAVGHDEVILATGCRRTWRRTHYAPEAQRAPGRMVWQRRTGNRLAPTAPTSRAKDGGASGRTQVHGAQPAGAHAARPRPRRRCGPGRGGRRLSPQPHRVRRRHAAVYRRRVGAPVPFRRRRRELA